MKYGLLGERLGHSLSPAIHEALGSAPYELYEAGREMLPAFFAARNFAGINVTIPYKQAVLPYLDRQDPVSCRTGAVNTIVKEEDGSLSGYNTDYAGFLAALDHAGIRVLGRKCLILGSGGASRTVRAALYDLGAETVVIVSRDPDAAKAAALSPISSADGTVQNPAAEADRAAAGTPCLFCDYQAVYTEHADAEIVINTTPVGMYPDCGASPLALSAFPRLAGVFDLIYNPLRTALLLEADARGIPCANGLYMLVAQAAASSRLFTRVSDHITCPTELVSMQEAGIRKIRAIFGKLLAERTNLIFIGMPGAGKTTVGALCAKALGRPFADLDVIFEKEAGMPIPDFFRAYGESAFRDRESEIASRFGKEGGYVIACGGGAVLREENYAYLKQNGVLIHLTRPVELLPTDPTRPLSSSREALREMEKARAPRYARFADLVIANEGTPLEAAKKAVSAFSGEMQDSAR